MNISELKQVLLQRFQGAHIEITDERGDGTHLSLDISGANELKGLSRVQSHRKIYEALGDYMKQIHALSIGIND